MAGEPIRLGSAAGTRLVFETGSKITTSDAGIQESSVKAKYGNAANVFDVLPVAGATFNSVFGNNFLPPDFKVDLTGGGHDVEYLEGNCARVTIKFKRPDPNATGPEASRKIHQDTTVRFESVLSIVGRAAPTTTSEDAAFRVLTDTVGLPEPTITVKYNDEVQPTYDRSYFAPPGSPPVTGFPNVPKTIVIPFQTGYYDGNTGEIIQTFFMEATWIPNPQGWQLTNIKADPVADESAWEIAEVWRMGYVFSGFRTVKTVP